MTTLVDEMLKDGCIGWKAVVREMAYEIGECLHEINARLDALDRRCQRLEIRVRDLDKNEVEIEWTEIAP